MRKKERAALIVEELKKVYPEGICSLQYPKPYELLFSVRLAAQCTDERVNQVTPPSSPASPPWRLWPPPT